MSQPGGAIYDVDTGESWALIAHSALQHSGDSGTGASGILAASSDIASIVLGGGIGDLFCFPNETDPPGLYLWHGKVEHEPDLDMEGKTELLHPDLLNYWLNRNGESK